MPGHDDKHVTGLDPCSQLLRPEPEPWNHRRHITQRLPNEILYHIVDRWCCQDLPLLYNLLFVNKFFFRAVLPHLWNNPFRTWSLNHDHEYRTVHEFKADRQNLMVTIFASFLEARLLEQDEQERQQPMQDADRCKSDAHRVDDILRPFGLCVAEGVQSPMLRHFLMNCNGRNNTGCSGCSNLGEADHGEENQMACTNRIRRMTVDYSKFFGALLSDDWRFLDFEHLLQLRSQPTCKRAPHESDSRPSSTPHTGFGLGLGHDSDSGIGEGDDDEADINNIDEEERKMQLTESITNLLLHYNHEIVTDIAMHISNASAFLDMAPKLAKLRMIQLQRSEAMPDSYMENMISFIQQNRKAFPGKAPIDLVFDYGWLMYDHEMNGHDFVILPGSVNDSNIMSYESDVMAHIGRQRCLQYVYMKPKVRLWEATGPPSEIRVTLIPLFYKHSQGIQLDRLTMFADEDLDRLDQGEGPEMQAFLRRCHHVEDLSLAVGSKDLFTWAAHEALAAAGYSPDILSGLLSDSVSEKDRGLSFPTRGPPLASKIPLLRPQSSGILRNLRTLDMYSGHPYRFLIHALNDAMVAFADTLRTVRVHSYHDNHFGDTWHAESLLRRRRARMTMPLYHVPWANTIGGGADFLPFPLLQLRTLSIDLAVIANVQVGTFEQCPNLESLEIGFGGVSLAEMHPDDQALMDPSSPCPAVPLTLGSAGANIALCNPRYQQDRIDRSLFPKWNLPRLQRLELRDLAALRFDFESLSSMQRLETLEMSVGKKTLSWYMPNEFISEQKSAWKKKFSALSSKGAQDGYTNGSSSNSIDMEACRKLWEWSLPSLKTVNLEGPPATMFFLDWLRGCPNLESLSLTTRGQFQSITRRPFFAPPLSPAHALDDSQEQTLEQPLLHGRLTNITIAGQWVMSDDDLLSLLTVYTPFLESLHIDRLHERSSLSGYQFLNVVRRADQINRSFTEAPMKVVQAQVESQNKSNEDCAASASEQERDRQRPKTVGTALKSITGKLTLNKRERPMLGLVMIQKEDVEAYQANNIRVYSLINQHLVAQEDYDLARPTTTTTGFAQTNDQDDYEIIY
ncbi:hypothetical protein B0O80DRAFT_531972 [Mortierella sp. GBAus27b]|nr:hypothetical protein BGX31_010881 [Mortierella sp. GBA43]KAI8349123.1 hypothetical protein B0O80DRAFT_531972 [Mortierella sp. GBAus27b]